MDTNNKLEQVKGFFRKIGRRNLIIAGAVVVIGAEADGVSALNGAARVTIPMPGNYESLNAAQAATVFLFEYVRRITAPAAGGGSL